MQRTVSIGVVFPICLAFLTAVVLSQKVILTNQSDSPPELEEIKPDGNNSYKILTGSGDGHSNNAGENHTSSSQGHSHELCELHVASFLWDHVQNSFIIAAFLFFSAIIKISFHHAGFLVSKIPESCLLIILGTIAGTIFTFATNKETFPEDLKTLSPSLFFMVLLPPIVLEASYSLHDRTFFENLCSILVFAVIGTLAGWFIIGPVLYGLSYAGVLGGDQFSFVHCMLFAAIVVAVDPVAVLAVFQEIGVNKVLYFLVFGESLLNDAVTVVLYQTMEGINCITSEGNPITVGMYAVAFCKFIATNVGGIIIGSIYGVLTSFLTKYTIEVRVVEPLLLFSLAYMSYVSAELFHFSGIVAITVCGLIQAQYAFHNISHKSYVTVKYFIKMAGSASDSVIFLFLGINLVRLDHVWHTGFTIATILLTLLVRFMVTYGLCFAVNPLRLRQISHREMFIMAYGGLRGAVAFSLVSLLTGKLDPRIQGTFMTTTLAVIIFTVFIQGGTIKPFVRLLDIRTASSIVQLSLFDELNLNVTDHVMAGIEEIVGKRGQFFFYDWLVNLDDKYIKHRLQKNPLRKDEKIMKLYEKIALKQHFANLRGTQAADIFIEKSKSVEDDTVQLETTGSQVSLQPMPALKGQRASLLSQLTRYGTLEEPEHPDDIAYITPDMLEDEEETSRSKRRMLRQQSTIADDMKTGHQLRILLNKPASSMDTRALTTEIEMDERSDLMYLLQEKNKRLERYKRSMSHVAPDQSAFSAVPSVMASIPEGRTQIVKRPRLQSSLTQESRINIRSKRGILGELPSSNTQIPENNNVNKGRKDKDKTSRLREMHGMKTLDDHSDDDSSRGSKDEVKSKEKRDRNNSNVVGILPKNKRSDLEPSDDSVFLQVVPEDVELLEVKKVNDDVLDLLDDVEKGHDQPLAQSSQGSARTFKLPTVTELSEDSPTAAEKTSVDVRPVEISSDSYDLEQVDETEALVPGTRSTSRNKRV